MPGVYGLGHSVHNGQHHGGGSRVRNPHREEHCGKHEAQHEPRLAGAHHHDDAESNSKQ